MGGGRLRGRFAKLRRDVRALSPIFAVLLLIAIAVIAGIIIYMYTSGYLATMLGGGTAGQEKVAIEAVSVSGNTVTLYCKTTGGGPVTITDVILRDAAGNTLATVAAGGTTTLQPGVLSAVTATFTLTSGNTYTAALVSRDGNQFVSQSFKA